jgi:hypothetical protein
MYKSSDSAENKAKIIIQNKHHKLHKKAFSWIFMAAQRDLAESAFLRFFCYMSSLLEL